VFDVYQGKGIADDRKSVAVGVTLSPTKATLTEDDIEATSTAIIAAVAKHCGGVLRG
jgi:phenylalanyl-tRNA synthetase beta chain